MDKQQFPKVYILLEPFNDSTGMGVTMTNLFKDWPRERIAIAAYNLDVELCEKIRPCQDYYAFSKPVKLEKNVIKPSLEHTSRLSVLRKAAKYIYAKFGINDFRRILVSEELKKSIADFQPDIIFTALGDLKRIRFVEQIMKFFPESKLAVYIVDDWPNTRQNGRCFSGLWKCRYDKALRRLLDKTSYCLSICQAMSDSYLAQYGKRFIPFHNPVDNELWQQTVTVRRYSEDMFAVVYVGKINRDTEENLLTLSKVVDSLNKRGIRVKFDIYTPSLHQLNIYKYEGCAIFPSVSNEQIPSILKGYDALYLTLGFSGKSRAYTRLSMPTKLTEYFAAGIPILLHAPAEIAVTKYVGETNTGVICTDNTLEALESALIRIINDEALREALKGASLYAAQCHDVKIIRTNFRTALSIK